MITFLRKKRRYLRKFHIWLGLFVGIQLLAWTLSGSVMVLLNMDLVHSDHMVSEKTIPIQAINRLNLLNLFKILPQDFSDISSIKSRNILDKKILEVRNLKGNIFLFDTKEQSAFKITENVVGQIAVRDLVKPQNVLQTILIKKNPPIEYRSRLPVWMVEFKESSYRLFVSPQTGKVVTRRNWIWRIYDFFWMLHIMDYSERDDSQNLLIQIVSIASAIFILSGIGLLLMAFRKKDFKLKRFW